MNLELEIFSAIAIAIITFIIGKEFGNRAKKDFATFLTILVFLPFILILLGGALGIISAGSNTTQASNAVNKMTTDYFALLGEELPKMFISEFLGVIIGLVGRIIKNIFDNFR